MRFKLILYLLLASTIAVFAQTDNEFINQFIERYMENSSDEIDIQQFASDLTSYYRNPLDLNKADATDLFAVPFLSGFQAMELIEHRKKFGNFISLYELQVLPSFGPYDIQNILPFVTIKSPSLGIKDIREIWKMGSHQLLTLVETSTPRKNGSLLADTLIDQSKSHYTGSSLYNSFRYRFDYKNNISVGVNMEKDAYEPFGNTQNPTGYDYYSFYFSLKNVGIIKALQLGDYQVNFGQGLTLSTGLAFGKSSIITNSKRNFNGFGAYRSLRENAFLRGGAAAFQFKNVTVGTFISYKKIDGNAIYATDTSDLNASGEILAATSIQEDGGLHRTLSEIEDKDAITDVQAGAYAEYKFPYGRIGTINYMRKLSVPLEPNLQLYNKYNFRGDEYFKNGVYYDLVYRNFNVYGEVSHSSFKNAMANVHGALLSLNNAMDISVVYRNYNKSFITMQSSGFSESSTASNEEGLYLGFESKLSRSLSLLGYFDLFKSKWLRSSADAPTAGSDFWSELHYKPNRTFHAYYRYRTETKQSNISGGQVAQLGFTTIQRHRFHTGYTITKGIELRNRIEYSIFEENRTKSFGSLIYQDILFKPFGSNLQLSGRVAYSVIDKFDNRIYSFEQVPLYDYPLFTHGFSGLRYYILARYKVRKGLDFWFRYAVNQVDVPLNSLENNFKSGSGLEEINGNIKRTLTLQIRYLIQ
jgi:hypothetical protein